MDNFNNGCLFENITLKALLRPKHITHFQKL